MNRDKKKMKTLRNHIQSMPTIKLRLKLNQANTAQSASTNLSGANTEKRGRKPRVHLAKQ